MANDLPFDLVINEGIPADHSGSHVQDSEHFDGLGVDLAATDGTTRYNIVITALKYGVNRIGVYNLHCHLGFSKILPNPVMWGGVSH